MTTVVENVEINKEELIKNKIKSISKPIEANVIGCFWSNPHAYFNYPDVTRDMFKSPRWQFYFEIGKKLALKNIMKIDEMAVELLIQNSDKTKARFNKYGGFEPAETVMECATVENMDSYINDLKKWSALHNIVEILTMEESMLDEFKDLDVNELYDYYNAQLNGIFINADDGVETHKLGDGLDEIIEEANKGLNVGMPINSPILNEEIGGVIDGQIILVGGLSGTGKTSVTIQLELSALFMSEEPGVIMLNEQDHVRWKMELLTWIINNILLKDVENPKYFNKKRWRQGNFTPEERELLKAASEFLKNKMDNNEIILCHFKSYSAKQAERIIRKYASLGVKKFVLDTFKISSDRDDGESFWLSMQEDMRKFDDLVKASNLNVNLWVTLQLQKGAVLKRYLTGDSIGMAKNVIDVASVGLLMRRLRNDEYEGGKFEIKVIDPISPESKMTGRTVTLDPNKKYVIFFIEKNRNGESQTYQIVAEQDLGTLRYKEVGICDIPFDS
ncbi:hypothetical protein ACDN41_11845 [Priestia aryabhattai]|uniref:hypothetical protein n=1 Tax=Priestia aryabhattai TaxID=412384 RepID=UPI0035320B62